MPAALEELLDDELLDEELLDDEDVVVCVAVLGVVVCVPPEGLVQLSRQLTLPWQRSVQDEAALLPLEPLDPLEPLLPELPEECVSVA